MKVKRERIILHIDFDSFFASVEQQSNPKLRGIPTGVTATNGRTCIIASSREAKRLGIGTGARTFEAFQICPNLQLIPADFVKYFEVSKKFINICKDYSPYVEMFSIDELFMDITSTAHLFGGVDSLIEKLKKRIKNEIGEYITVSIGISYNKMLAKLGSGFKKPNGITLIKHENLDDIYDKAVLTKICGIGERIRVRLNKIGIYNLTQLRSIPLHRLIAEFGRVEGWFLKNVGWGIDDSPIVPYTNAPDVKSVGRNYCMPQNQYDEQIVLQNFYELCEEVSIKLRRLNRKAHLLGFSFRGSVSIHARQTYSSYFNTGKEMYDLGISLIKTQDRFKNNLLQSGEYIRQLSIWVSGLEDPCKLTLSLFDHTIRQEKLIKVIDTLNERFGDHTIRNGYLLYAAKLTTVPNGYMADRYERIKLAKEAKDYF